MVARHDASPPCWIARTTSTVLSVFEQTSGARPATRGRRVSAAARSASASDRLMSGRANRRPKPVSGTPDASADAALTRARASVNGRRPAGEPQFTGLAPSSRRAVRLDDTTRPNVTRSPCRAFSRLFAEQPHGHQIGARQHRSASARVNGSPFRTFCSRSPNVSHISSAFSCRRGGRRGGLAGEPSDVLRVASMPIFRERGCSAASSRSSTPVTIWTRVRGRRASPRSTRLRFVLHVDPLSATTNFLRTVAESPNAP